MPPPARPRRGAAGALSPPRPRPGVVCYNTLCHVIVKPGVQPAAEGQINYTLLARESGRGGGGGRGAGPGGGGRETLDSDSLASGLWCLRSG